MPAHFQLASREIQMIMKWLVTPFVCGCGMGREGGLAAWLLQPQSFLTAIMQSTARKNELPLDKMCLVCEVTKKIREEVTQPPKEGAFVHCLFMEVVDKILFSEH